MINNILDVHNNKQYNLEVKQDLGKNVQKTIMPKEYDYNLDKILVKKRSEITLEKFGISILNVNGDFVYMDQMSKKLFEIKDDMV